LNCFKEIASPVADHRSLAGKSRGPGAGMADPSPAEIVDLRALEPPEPLVRILERLDTREGPHVFLLAREPSPLYPLLALSGWRHETRVDERGYVVTVHR
jgi:hypothetical protein